MTDQHQCLVILREFANVNIDETAGTSLKFNIEWREERDSVFQDRGVSHDFNCVSFYNWLEIKRCARECCIQIGSDRGAAVGHDDRVVHTVAEANAGALRQRMARRHYRTQLADCAGERRRSSATANLAKRGRRVAYRDCQSAFP